MKAYIYFIINNINGKRYVGQTVNYSRRKSDHINMLNKNKHINMKLQNAWNKYGKDNFTFQKITYDDITQDELNEYEIYYINKYDSRENGYNIAFGGSNGSSRDKLDFDQYCFAYFGNKKYDGMTNRTGKFLGVDSSCIASIKREDSYKNYLDKAVHLTNEEKERYIKLFEEKMNIKENKPWKRQYSLNQQMTYDIICVCATYGRGAEGAIIKKFLLSKGFVFHLFTQTAKNINKVQQHTKQWKERAKALKQYYDTPEEEIYSHGKEKFNEWSLQSFSKRKIKEDHHNLFEHYGIANYKDFELLETLD